MHEGRGINFTFRLKYQEALFYQGFQMSLRNKFLLVLSFSLLAFSGSFVYVTVSLVTNEWVRSKERLNLGFAKEEAREISQWISDQVQKAYLVADKYDSPGSGKQVLLQDNLNRLEGEERQAGERVYFLTYSSSGRVRYSSIKGITDVDSVKGKTEKFFFDLRKLRTLSPLTRYFKITKTGRFIIVSVPCVGAGGSFRGTLNEIIDFESTAFAKSLRDFTNDANGYMEITKPTGEITTDGINLDTNRKAPARESVSDMTQSGAFEKKNKEVVTYAKISLTPWYVTVVQPVTELDAELSHLKENYAWMIAVGLLSIFVVSYLISDSMARPLKGLLIAMHKAANREFNKVEVRSTGEMKLLIDSFNLMTMSLERKYSQIDALNEFSSSVIVDIRESNIFNRISKSAALALGTEMAAVMMPDEKGALTIKGPYGIIQSEIRMFELPSGEGLCGIAFEEGRTVVANKPESDPNFYTGNEGAKLVRNLMSAPIVADGKPIGVLTLFNTKDRSDFKSDDIKLFETFANQAGIAIQNSHLYGRLREDLERIQTLQNELVQSEKLSAVGQLVSGVAHELNNPLGVILGFSQLASGSVTDRHLSQYLQRIEESAVRASDIVKNLLTFARKETPKRSVVNLNEVVTSVLDLISHPLNIRKISVVRDDRTGVNETVANFQQLQQVFLNLFTNSMQAMEETEDGVITVKTYREEDRLVVLVSDNGPGIRPEILGKVFDPFFTTKAVGKGTGLGLSVTYSIMKSFGGDIRVESKPGKGATFMLELPAVVSAVAEQIEPAIDLSKLNGVRILFVEDEEEMRAMVKEALAKHGCIVTPAENGLEALDLVDTEDFDIVVSDLRMPKMDGEEFYKKLISRKPPYSRRFIFSSGDTARDSTRDFLKESRCVVIMKPFTILQLASEVVRTVTSAESQG